LQSSPESSLAKLFVVNADGTVSLGWSATTKRPINVSRLLQEPVEFQDYIMEGFVSYTLQIQSHPQGSELVASGFGSNRDQYICPQVRHFIVAAGITIVSELT
jgi:hypothetical protein